MHIRVYSNREQMGRLSAKGKLLPATHNGPRRNWIANNRLFSVRGAAGAIILALLALQLADTDLASRLRFIAFDSLQTLAPRAQNEATFTTTIDVDEESIERIGQWPWPRTDIAKLTDRLNTAGAAVIAYDIVFSEADRTSPENVAERVNDEALRQELSQLATHDQALATSIGDANVVLASFLSKEERGREFEPKVNFTLSGSMPQREVAKWEGSIQPLPQLEDASAGNGFVSLESDLDGVVRRVPMVAIHRGQLIPSLSLEAVRTAQGDAGNPNLLTSDGTGETLASPGAAVAVRLGEIEIPVNEAGEAWVHFADAGSQSVVPAWEILSDDFDVEAFSDQLSGKIVYVGGSAEGLQDLVATPVNPSIAGVSVHAAITEQIMAGHFLQRPDWATGLEMLITLLLAGGLSWFLPRLGAVKGALLAAGGVILVSALCYFAFTSARFLIDPTFPALAVVLVYVFQTGITFYFEERQRAYLHSAFDRFLSPDMVKQIINNPDKLKLGGEERDMSVMMCDVRGFSKISERYAPTQVIDFLIEFLTPMSDILLKHKATLDKYIGDAILAFWNAPLDDPDHHRNAADAALRMVEELEELNRIKPLEADVTWPGEVAIGIGLNSGTCCVGNMGSRQRLDYSLIGDTVNVAARFEGLTKQYGVKIIAGSNLVERLETYAFLEVDKVRVVGRDTPEAIYTLLGDEGYASQPQFADLERAHSAMLSAYRAMEWDAALKALKDAEQLYEEAGIPLLAKLFAQRIEGLKASPPADNWDGVFDALVK